MNTRAFICVQVLVISVAAWGQVVEITSFRSNGEASWVAPSGSVCTIEWASTLHPAPDWRRGWNEITGVLMTNSTATARVPLFYRVVCDTSPLSMITPYVDEDDMLWVRQGYSTTADCPWGFVHDGVDFEPAADLAPFRAVCDGTITELCLRHAPPSDGGRQNWDVYVELTYDSTWAVAYNFEPKTTNVVDGVTQLENIAVSLLQEVSQGDVIGSLHEGDESAHVHFSVLKNGYMYHNGVVMCPKPFFTPEAQLSILELVRERFPAATDFCY